MTTPDPNFAIIIPAYNESLTIHAVATSALKYSPWVIVIDDASKDNTAELAKQTDAIVIEHEQNQGKAGAMLSGFKKAIELGADYVITIDGDGQHSPDNVPQLQAAYVQYPEHLIIAARLKNRENAPRARLIANKIADFWVSWAASKPIADSQSGFRLYPIRLLKEMQTRANNPSGFVFESEILIDASRQGFDFVFVPIESSYPELRRASHFRPGFDITQITLMVAKKLLRRALNLPGLFNSLIKKPTIFE